MTGVQLRLFEDPGAPFHGDARALRAELAAFRSFGRETVRFDTVVARGSVRRPVATFVNEFWTSRQRAACSLHEVSYRACFKPQLPRFFVERLTRPGERVHDPFLGRGTTAIEAALLGRLPSGTDVNPLSTILTAPRLEPPTLAQVEERLRAIPFDRPGELREDLLVFYHPDTLAEICALRRYFAGRALDAVDRWIRMVAVNRLTGHSPGFFSVYTMPPNQAVSIRAQRKINARRGQRPERRSVPELVLRKSRSLLAGCTPAVRETLRAAAAGAVLLTGPGSRTPALADGAVSLAVTSPPFLDVVQYADDNWLRCWFCGIDAATVPITVLRRLADWQAAMAAVFVELARVLRPGGWVAFEVGEVRGGTLKLEDAVVPCGVAAGLEPELILINDQEFTKTANCWGVRNNAKGTNTNRVVVFSRPR